MPHPPDHPNVQAVVAALRAGGAAASGARMRVLPDAVSTARAAADALGIEVGQIANSLIFVLERSAGGTGIPHAVFPTGFAELITLTGGAAAAVAEGS